jgi:hypothetical protein
MSAQRPDETPREQNPNPPEAEYKDRWQRRWERRERRDHDPLRGLFWGLLLILGGIIWLAVNQDWIVPNDNWWQYFLIGLGAIFIIDSVAHYLSTAHRWRLGGRMVAGVVLVVVGLASIYGWGAWWPLILIAAGVAVLFGFLFRRG